MVNYPLMGEMERISMANMNEIESFLAEVEQKNADNKTPTRYVNRDRLKANIDEDSGYSNLYNGYILEGYTSGIEGQYGESTAVRLIEPGTGRRQTLWLTGYEQEHLKNHLATWQDAEGATFPMEIKFLRHKVPSKNGRKYNRFSATLLNHGENLVIPPVPEEQYESQDEN